MNLKIRAKLIIAFFAMLVPFSLVFLTNYFFTKAVQENLHISRDISYELENLGDLQLALDQLLMPANDYIISGDAEERLDFDRLAEEVERHIALIPMEKRCQQCHPARTAEMVARLYSREASKDMSEEMLILKEIRDKFEEIKKYGEAIFSIQMPAGSAVAAGLMKEMDALANKVINGPINRHRQMEKMDMQKAGEVSEKAWRRFQLGRTLGYLAALIVGVIIALLYSGRLASVIKLLHKGSDGIAKGDFKTRLAIKTGDELEQLANAMNGMATQLDSLYSNLEQKVEEKTRDLRESEERFKAVTESAGDAIISLKSPGIICIWNRKAENIFGYTTDEAMGRNMHDLIVPERYREKAFAGLSSFFHTGAGPVIGRTIEIEALHRSGEEFPVELAISAVNMEGEWRTIGIVRDITERKKMEDQLKDANNELNLAQDASINIMEDLDRERKRLAAALKERDELLEKVERSNKELQDFAYIVSHDLKAPLRAIGTITSWLAEDYKDKLDDAGREQLVLLLNRTQRMHNMIEGILHYSRAGRVMGEPVQVNTEKIVKDVISALSPPANIRITIRDSLPSVFIDPLKIGQVFQNLISNALKYMDKPEGLIDVGCRDAGEFWEFYVKDNGPGIEERHFEKIFQIFQTLKPRDEFESTGIGLSIVKKIIEQNSGRIWVESEIGKGSTFKFTLKKT